MDPSASRIEDEHQRLANYLKERYLTIDCYDAVTQFYFGSTKVPLFDLLRQGKNIVVRPKECEIFNPDSN